MSYQTPMKYDDHWVKALHIHRIQFVFTNPQTGKQKYLNAQTKTGKG